MAHKHDKHFIPSPFPTVTQYENTFINSWKKGDFGIIPLTDAIDKYFKDFKIKTSRNPYNL